MSVDILSILVKSLAYVALLQAAGVALFLAEFGPLLERSSAGIRAIGTTSGVAAVVTLLLFYCLEAARMTGEYSGLLDPGLLTRLLSSGLGVATTLRLLGAVLITIGVRRATAGMTLAAVMGAAMVIASFLLTGHSVTHSPRWALAPLLEIHLLVAAFWFGSIAALGVVAVVEEPASAQVIIGRFSRIAGVLVPALAAAGVSMAWLLIGDTYSISDAYSLAITGKAVLFAMALALAALNRWRLGPALASRTRQSRRAFCRSLIVEYALLVGVVVITAALTNMFSPVHAGNSTAQ